MRIGGGRFLYQLRSPQSSSDSPLEQAGSNRQYRVRRPRFRERGSCRLCLPQRRRRRDETRYHDDGGGLPRDRWFESGFLQRGVYCEPEFRPASPIGFRILLGRVRRCRALTDRVVDVTPTLDGFDVAVHRVEVRAHRHDRYVAPPSPAPRRNIARPLVVPATVLLDGLEAECIGIPSELEQLSLDPRLDLDRLGLSPARKRNPSPIPAARSNAASLKPPSQMGI